MVAGPRYLPGLSVCLLPCPQPGPSWTPRKCGGDIILRNNAALRDTVVHFLHRAHASVQVEAGAGLFPDHSQSRPANILVNWNLGRPVALDISVVSPLNPSTLAEAGATDGAVLEATESRKHQANDEKCSALGWVSTPLAVDSYGARDRLRFFLHKSQLGVQFTSPCQITGIFRPVLYLNLK